METIRGPWQNPIEFLREREREVEENDLISIVGRSVTHFTNVGTKQFVIEIYKMKWRTCVLPKSNQMEIFTRRKGKTNERQKKRRKKHLKIEWNVFVHWPLSNWNVDCDISPENSFLISLFRHKRTGVCAWVSIACDHDRSKRASSPYKQSRRKCRVCRVINNNKCFRYFSHVMESL